MKFIFCFFVFVLISTTVTLSKPLDNDSNSLSITELDIIRIQIDLRINLTDYLLTSVKSDLIKKKKEKEAAKVETLRKFLISSSHLKCNETVDFIYKYAEYIGIEESFDAFSNIKYLKTFIGVNGDRVYFLSLIDRLSFWLKRVRIGLTKNQLIDEAKMAKDLIMALKTQVNLIFNESYDFVDKYFPEQQPIIPDDPKKTRKEDRDFIKVTVNEIVEYLTKIENGLKKDGKTIEANEVGSRLRLIKDPEFLKFHLEASDFTYDNVKYWIPPKSFNLKSISDFTDDSFLFVLRGQTLILRECEKGLIKDKKETDAKKAYNFKKGLENQFIPAYEDSFFYKDVYSNYLYP